MATAQIRVDGVIGSKDSFIIGNTPVFTNNDNTGATTWLWQLVSKPVGSVATLATPTTSASALTIDVEGSYLVRLIVNGSSVVDEVYVAAKSSHLALRPVAGLETLQDDTVVGWANDLNDNLKKLERGIRFRTSVTVRVATTFSGPGVGYVTGIFSLPNGDVVYTVAPASAATAAQTRNLVWLNAAAAANDVVEGTVIGLTSAVINTGASSLGAPVYLGDTAGSVVFTPGTNERKIGYVVVVGASGRIKFSAEAEGAPRATVDPLDVSDTAADVGTSPRLALEDHVHLHGDLDGGDLHALVVADPGGSHGFMSKEDKAKLDSWTFNVAIWDPGAALTTADNIFTDFADAVNYLAAVSGPRILFVYGSGTVSTAGAYDLTDIEIIGASSGAGMTVSDGVTFPGLRKVMGNIIIEHGGLANVVDDFVTGDVFELGVGASIIAVDTGEGTAVASFIFVPANVSMLFKVAGSFRNASTRYALVECEGVSSGTVSLVIEAHMRRSDGGISIGANTWLMQASTTLDVRDLTGKNAVSTSIGGVSPLAFHDAAFFPCGSLYFKTPATGTVAANTNDYGSVGQNSVLHLNVTASVNLTGILAPTLEHSPLLEQKILYMKNVGTNPLTLKHESGSSSANNRFNLPDGLDVVIAPNHYVVLMYDVDPTDRWTVIGGTGASARATRAVSDAAVTVLSTDYYVSLTALTAPRIVTLPASIPDGVEFMVKDESGDAGTFNITVKGNGSETIDNAAGQLINQAYGSVSVIRRNGSWWTT